MAERDYTQTPVSDSLGLREVIRGLSDDLVELRSKQISPNDALARAALAKQIFNGVRLYVQAIRVMEGDTSSPTLIEANSSKGRDQ